MLEVTNILVRSFSLEYLDVYWSLADTYEDIDAYSFYVLRSEAPEGPYQSVAGPFESTFHFRDTSVPLGRKLRDWYYRIRVVNKSTSDQKDFPSVAGALQRARPTLEALEIARTNRLVLQEKSGGRRMVIFPRKTWGQRCRCVDPVTQAATSSRCLTCYDTGFVGGFHRPILIWGSVVTPIDQLSSQITSEVTTQDSYIRLANYPLPQPGWVVVEAENKRWRVGEQITRVERHRYVVRQVVGVHAIPLGDVEYSLPVDLDETFEPTPVREFTNPRALGSNDRAIFRQALSAFLEGEP